jgi:hypothetical protein
MKQENKTDFVQNYCPEFVGKDDVALPDVLQALAEAREKSEELEQFMLRLGDFLAENEMLAFNTHVGTAKDEKNGIELKFSSTLHHAPTVECKKTGKTFMLSWQGIARLAVRCGVADDKKAS